MGIAFQNQKEKTMKFPVIIHTTEERQKEKTLKFPVINHTTELPFCKLYKTTSPSNWNFDRDNLAKWNKRLSERIISDFRVQPSNKNLNRQVY